MLTDLLYFTQLYPVMFLVMVGILGLCIGSFLNVAIYRIPIMLERQFATELAQATNQSAPQNDSFDLFLPRSHCPNCQTPIPWWANIPVLSYLFLRGNSYCCQQPISSRYPLVEILSMTVTLLVANNFGISWTTLAALLFCWGLITLFFIDLDQFLLPDDITLPLLWLGLYSNLYHSFTSIQSAVIGAIAGYCIFWSVGFLFKTIRGIEGIGQGDYKLLAMLGAWLGWQQLPLIIMLSSFAGAIWGLFGIIFHRKKQLDPIPFGPFLALAGFVSLLWGNKLIITYLRWQGFNIHNFFLG